jgi:hypothetical protein
VEVDERRTEARIRCQSVKTTPTAVWPFSVSLSMRTT